jgi:hypothetical protein
LTSHNPNPYKPPGTQQKTASISWGNHSQQKKKTTASTLYMGEFPSKEHSQDCYGTLLDNFLEIDAIIGDVIY